VFQWWPTCLPFPAIFRLPMLAVLHLALEEIDGRLEEPAMAIDADTPHHKFVAALAGPPRGVIPVWDDTPRHPDGCSLMLMAPGHAVQMRLHLEDSTPGEAVVKVLREWKGPAGLRHWSAFLKLLSIEGNREGFVRWTIDDHHSALGYRTDKSRRAGVRKQTLSIMQLFSDLELAVIGPDGKERVRRPLILVAEWIDKPNVDGEWELNGAQLQINPLLYTGVRKGNGEIGKNWWPQSTQLPRLNHQRHPYALALGLTLPIRWRMEWRCSKTPYVRLAGSNLLRMAGIKLRSHRPGQAWRALQRDLKALHKKDCLGRVEVHGDLNDPATMWDLYAPEWQLDRTIRGLLPKGSWCESVPLTGAELKEWREKKGWSQAALAKAIGKTAQTVYNNEKRGVDSLTRGMRRALEELLVTS